MTEPRSMLARVIAYVFGVMTLAIHGVVAWMSPVQSDDWGHWTWSKTHDHTSGVDWLIGLVSTRYTSADLVGFVIAQSTVVHTIVTPLVGLVLVLGLFTIASRRLPRADSMADVVGIIVISALTWIAAPHAAVTWFHRPYAATWIYGAAAALWLLAPYRCGWRPRGAWVPALFVLGLFAGSSSRQTGTVLLFGVLYAIRHTPKPRPRWMWIGAAGVAIGTVVVYFDWPQVDFKGFKAGFESSLGAVGLSLREGGELISLVLGLALAKLALGSVRPAWSGDGSLPETHETMRWLWTWFAFTLLALLGPRYSEAFLFPASLVLCIAALPYFNWLMTSRPLRIAICTMAVGIHVVIWAFSLAYYVPLGAEYRDRVAKLESTPAGGVATIDPYSTVLGNYWFYGEDWAEISKRQSVALKVFDLRDIAYSSSFRNFEANPSFDIRLEIDGVSQAELTAARVPAYWGSNVGTARGLFEDMIDALEGFDGRPFSARLVVVNFELDVLRGRKLLVAAYDRGEPTIPKIVRKPPDEDNVQAIVVRPGRLTTEYSESYRVIANRASPLKYETGYRVRTMTTELHGVVACDPKQCLLVDAFVPNL